MELEMTAPKPEIKVMEPKGPEKGKESLEGQEPKTQDIPPISTEPQQAPPTDEERRDKIIAAQMEVIREMQQNQMEMKKQLDSIANPPAPAPSIEEQDKKFWESPTKRMREEMQSAVQPLYDFVNDMKSGTDYDRAKALLRDDPKYKEVFDKAENYIDELMKNQKPTVENLKAVIYGVRGAVEVGDIPGITFSKQAEAAAKNLGIPTSQNPEPPQPAPEQPTESSVNMSTVPAHLRPSAPPTPKPAQKQTIDPNSFTENERRLAREYGMSLEEYAEWMSTPPDKVVTTELGRNKE